MKRKLISLLLCAAVTAGVLSGCGSQDDAGNAGSEAGEPSAGGEEQPSGADEAGSGAGASVGTVSLRLWGAEEDQDLLAALVEKFKAAYPDQDFDIQIGVESESSAMDTVLKDVEAAADVFAFASDQLPQLVNAGALANLDEVGEALTVAGKTLDDVKAANMETAVEAASSNGNMYAFPMAGDNSYFMYYDSSIISDEDVQNWDTLLAAAQKGGKKAGMTFASGWYAASFFYGAGFTTALNEDGSTSIDWNGTSPSGIKGTDVVKAMLKIAADPAFLPVADGQSSNILSSGDVCAIVSGTWDAVTAQKMFGENYAAVKLPSFTIGDEKVQMAPAYGYKFIGVNAYSEDSGWAVLLADFLTNEESQAERFAKRAIGPTNSNVLAADEVKSNIAIEAVTSQAEYGVLQIVGGKFWDPVKTLGEVIAQGGLKESDEAGIQDALDTLVEGVTAPVG